MDIRRAIAEAADLQPISVSPEAQTAAFDFMARRLEQLLVDSAISVEVARAVLNERSNDPLLAQKTALELQALLPSPSMYSSSGNGKRFICKANAFLPSVKACPGSGRSCKLNALNLGHLPHLASFCGHTDATGSTYLHCFAQPSSYQGGDQ